MNQRIPNDVQFQSKLNKKVTPRETSRCEQDALRAARTQ